MANDIKINALWIGHHLSPVELLCIHSWVAHGYIFQLWIYDVIDNIPSIVEVKDANLIIPKAKIFRYKYTNQFGHGKGSLAGFSDIFRYKLLYEEGGIWIDMDIICLKKIDIEGQYIFRFHDKEKVVGNFIQCPPKSDLMHYCYEKATDLVDENNKDWMLPLRILGEGICKYELQNSIYDISNKDQWPIILGLLKGKKPSDDWCFLHLVNEEFRSQNVTKEAFLKRSFLHHLLVKYNIPHQIVAQSDLYYKLKISRVYYTILHFKNFFQILKYKIFKR
jgi:hypothetical protein